MDRPGALSPANRRSESRRSDTGARRENRRPVRSVEDTELTLDQLCDDLARPQRSRTATASGSTPPARPSSAPPSTHPRRPPRPRPRPVRQHRFARLHRRRTRPHPPGLRHHFEAINHLDPDEQAASAPSSKEPSFDTKHANSPPADPPAVTGRRQRSTPPRNPQRWWARPKTQRRAQFRPATASESPRAWCPPNCHPAPRTEPYHLRTARPCAPPSHQRPR